ncbi:hypothetical protein FACS1894200_03360 [Spirochaetia bacterium]|nr:hypothetical protein FACS1894200_03360 [Spirochaetia bacterium]
MFRIDVDCQKRINSIDGIMIVTRNSLFPVHKGDKLAAVKVVPLEIEDELLQQAEALAEQGPILEILPYKLKTAGLVITGSEIKGGRIQDTFEPLLAKRLKVLGIQLTKISITGDGLQNILGGIAEIRAAKPDIVLCTGGMSVDPDDNTPGLMLIHKSMINARIRVSYTVWQESCIVV